MMPTKGWPRIRQTQSVICDTSHVLACWRLNLLDPPEVCGSYRNRDYKASGQCCAGQKENDLKEENSALHSEIDWCHSAVDGYLTRKRRVVMMRLIGDCGAIDCALEQGQAKYSGQRLAPKRAGALDYPNPADVEKKHAASTSMLTSERTKWRLEQPLSFLPQPQHIMCIDRP